MKYVPLGQVATIERQGVSPDSMPGTTRYLGLEHIARGGQIIGHSTVREAALASTKFRFDAEHILYGKLRPNLGKISRPDFDGICSTDILPIRCDTSLDRGYLAHFLSQPDMVEYAAVRAAGVNLPRLNPSVLASFRIPLPSLAQQQRIAAILDQADALGAKRRQALAHLDALTQSIFHDMFTPDTGPSWELAELGTVVGEINSGSSPKCEARPATADEWGVLKLSAVTSGTFNAEENKAYFGSTASLQRHEVRAGDVLMTRKNTRQLVGAVAVVPATRKRLLLPDLIFRLHLDSQRLDPAFFQAMMMSTAVREQVRRLASGSAASMPNISKARLRKLLIPIPPLQLQQEFARARSEIAAQSSQAYQALAKETELFTSLQSRAFRGEL